MFYRVKGDYLGVWAVWRRSKGGVLIADLHGLNGLARILIISLTTKATTNF